MLLALLLCLVTSASAEKIDLADFALKRSVKVCATYTDNFNKCGTGIYIDQGVILTQSHIIDPVTWGVRGAEMQVLPQEVSVLKHDGTQFVPVIVEDRNSDLDLAVLRSTSSNRTVKFTDYFYRGQPVLLVGNPVDGDFVVAHSTILGVVPEDGRNLIVVDNRDGQIKPGFSGGAVFDASGQVLGTLEKCSVKNFACLAIPSKNLKQYILEVR